MYIEVCMNLKGSLPLLILHILSKSRLHGYQIARQIEDQSEGVLTFKEGTLYPTLHSLENQGLVSSYAQQENGRTRRYYEITKAGHDALANQTREWQRFAGAVNLILNGGASS
jgi:PadR family transcriptional regulator, regulatory protein PadR